MDTKKIKEIIEIFETSQISKMDLHDGDLHLTLEKETTPIEKINSIEKQQVEDEPSAVPIKSPLVGTYYQASGEGQPPYVKVGDHVNVGDTLCIIEAMKVMNEIKSDIEGTIVSIEVKNGQAIEYDQTLMMIV